MLSLDEDALVCDFAETYGVFNIYELQPSLAATLACGLRDDSRIKLKISGRRFRLETLMLARLVDGVSYILWQRSQDALDGRNQPASLLQELLGLEDEAFGFSTPEEFEMARQKFFMEG